MFATTTVRQLLTRWGQVHVCVHVDVDTSALIKFDVENGVIRHGNAWDWSKSTSPRVYSTVQYSTGAVQKK